MPAFHNEALRPLLHHADARDDLARIAEVLDARRTLQLVSLPNGLYPAVPPGAPSAARYACVWVRDNVMIANALRETGRTAEAAHTMRTLVAYFERHLSRFDRIIDGQADPADPMQRPNIRFDGATLDELPETWAHAQNDALGYALFQTARLAREGAYAVRPEDVAVLSRFPAYFEAIGYWKDADSGHWEEARKVEKLEHRHGGRRPPGALCAAARGPRNAPSSREPPGSTPSPWRQSRGSSRRAGPRSTRASPTSRRRRAARTRRCSSSSTRSRS